MTNILSALANSKQKKLDLVSDYDKQERIMIDGMWSISDEVFECELWRLGVSSDVINDRLKEPVENREAVLAMYNRMIHGNEEY